MQRISSSLVFICALLFATHAVAKSASSKATRGKPATAKAARKDGTTKKPVRRKRRHKRGFTGTVAHKRFMRQDAPSRPSGNVHIIHQAVKQEVTVNIYNKDGSFNQAALAKLDGVFQCRRTREVRAIDPRLYEMLSRIYDKFGSKRIELTSGFRYQRNEGSRHFHGSAMDVRIPGVNFRKLYRFAESLDSGKSDVGMGIGKYPGKGFVHIDFRAPGEKSYRWTDKSRKGRGRDKRPSRMWRRSRKPNS